MSGPLKRVPQSPSGSRSGPWTWTPSDTCGAGAGKEWHYTTCPACQCNGHSVCSNVSSPGTCHQPCGDNTQGEHCQRCSDGFFGNPVNGGQCSRYHCTVFTFFDSTFTASKIGFHNEIIKMLQSMSIEDSLKFS